MIRESRRHHWNDRFFGLVVVLGTALAIYTVLLKVIDLPCVTDSCSEVMNSAYGSIVGIPVGLFALPLWVALIYPGAWIRRLSSFPLIGGSIYFVSVQYLILESFCVICLLHALAAFSLVAFRRIPELTSTPVCAGLTAGVGLIAVSVFGGAGLSESSFETVRERESSNVEANVRATGFAGDDQRFDVAAAPLFSREKGRGILVLNVSCSSCVRLVEEILAGNYSNRAVWPVVWLTNDQNRSTTEILMAASMDSGEVAPGRFARAFTTVVINDRQDFYSGDADGVRRVLERDFPDLDDNLPAARSLIENHKEFVNHTGVTTTPAVLLNGEQHRMHSLNMIID